MASASSKGKKSRKRKATQEDSEVDDFKVPPAHEMRRRFRNSREKALGKGFGVALKNVVQEHLRVMFAKIDEYFADTGAVLSTKFTYLLEGAQNAEEGHLYPAVAASDMLRALDEYHVSFKIGAIDEEWDDIKTLFQVKKRGTATYFGTQGDDCHGIPDVTLTVTFV